MTRKKSKKGAPDLTAHLAATAQRLECILSALLKDEENREHPNNGGKQMHSLQSQPPTQAIKQEIDGKAAPRFPQESKPDVPLTGADISVAPRQGLLDQLDSCFIMSLRTLKKILQKGLPRETALPCLFRYEWDIQKIRRVNFGDMANKENMVSITKKKKNKKKKCSYGEIALTRFITYEKDVKKVQRVYFGKITNKENETFQKVAGKLTNQRLDMNEEEEKLRNREREEALRMENMKDFIMNDEEVKSEVRGSIRSQRDEQMNADMRGHNETYRLPLSAQVQDTFVKIKKEDAPPQARRGAPSGVLQSHPGIDANSHAKTVIEKDEQTGHARHIRQIAATSTANTSRFSLGAQACIGTGAALKRKQSISNEDVDPSKVAKLSHEISAFGDIRESLHRRYGESLGRNPLEAAEKRKRSVSNENEELAKVAKLSHEISGFGDTRESLHRQYGEGLERNMLDVAEKRKIEGDEWERKEEEKKLRRKLKKARRLQRRKDAKHTAMNENVIGDKGQKSMSYDKVDAPMSGHRLSGMKRLSKISLEERQERNRAKWGKEFSWLPEAGEGLGDSESSNDTGTQKFKDYQYDASRRTSSMTRKNTPSESSSSEGDSSVEGDTSQLLSRPDPSPFWALATTAMATQNKEIKNEFLAENNTANAISDMKIAASQGKDDIPHADMPGHSDTVADLISPAPIVSSASQIETKILCSDNELRPRGDEDEAMLTFISWEREEQQKLGRGGGRLNPVATYIRFQSNKLKGSSECMSADQAAMFVEIVFGIGSAEALVQFKKILEVVRSEFKVDREYNKDMERFGRASLRTMQVLDADLGDPFVSYFDAMVAVEFFKYLQNSRSSFAIANAAAETNDHKELLAATHWTKIDDLQLDELACGNDEERTSLFEMREIGFRFTQLMNIYNPGIMALIPGGGRFGDCLNAIIEMSKAEFEFLYTHVTNNSDTDPFVMRSSVVLEEYAVEGMQDALSLPELRLESQTDEAILGLKEKSAQLALLCLPA